MTNTIKQMPVNRNYKARIFEMVFSDKKELLALYNAVNETTHENPEELEINTLENAIYLSMHNDISFVIDSRLSLYEHQSTYSPNLPLRYLHYVSDLYSVMTKDSNLYGTTKVRIPPPKFLIFYNGSDERPETETLCLSDLFTIPDEDISLELKATMLNINPGNNEPIKNACKTLKDYVEYTTRVRAYAETMPLTEAVDRAINECIQEGILKEFLTKHRAEARAMSIYEYDEEKTMRQMREESFENGYASGKEDGYASGKEDGYASGKEDGYASGKKTGEMCINKLNQKLAELGRVEDIIKAAQDSDYQKKLLKELGIILEV